MQNKRILIINYEMSDHSQVFSHQIELVRILSPFYKKISVLTGFKDSYSDVPANVEINSYDWNRGKRITNVLKFYRRFFKVFFYSKPDLVFSHMTEVQSALISPFLRLCGVPHVLWYAHKSKSPYLVWNSYFVNRIVTSTLGSCPLENKKVIPIGQAINEANFIREIRTRISKDRFIHIGRFDPSKNIEKLINVILDLKEINPNVSFRLIGNPSSDLHKKYADSLREKYSRYSFITFEKALPRNELANLLFNSDVFFHAFEGSLDKALIEATMAGTPVVTINKEYLKEFGCWGKDLSLTSLRSELDAFLKTPEPLIMEKCEMRQKIALSRHSLTRWVGQLTDIFNDLMAV